MATDILDIEVLDDGTIKVSSGKVSMQNHMSAEAFLRTLQQVAGEKQERKHKHGMTQTHTHEHEHA